MNIPIAIEQLYSWYSQLEAAKLATNNDSSWPAIHTNRITTRIMGDIDKLMRPNVEHEQAEPGRAS